MSVATVVDEREIINKIVDHLTLRAKRSHFDVVFPATDKLRLDSGTFLIVHAVVKSGNSAGEKVDILQELEDDWNDSKQHGEPNLLILPVAA